MVLYFLKIKEILIRSKKAKLIHFKSEKIETSIKIFLKMQLVLVAHKYTTTGAIRFWLE